MSHSTYKIAYAYFRQIPLNPIFAVSYFIYYCVCLTKEKILLK